MRECESAIAPDFAPPAKHKEERDELSGLLSGAMRKSEDRTWPSHWRALRDQIKSDPARVWYRLDELYGRVRTAQFAEVRDGQSRALMKRADAAKPIAREEREEPAVKGRTFVQLPTRFTKTTLDTLREQIHRECEERMSDGLTCVLLAKRPTKRRLEILRKTFRTVAKGLPEEEREDFLLRWRVCERKVDGSYGSVWRTWLMKEIVYGIPLHKQKRAMFDSPTEIFMDYFTGGTAERMSIQASAYLTGDLLAWFLGRDERTWKEGAWPSIAERYNWLQKDKGKRTPGQP